MSCSPGSILGLPAVIHSAAMRRVMEMVKRVAQTDASVLITGESGVGKELVARALHEQSLRCNSPWVDLNCGALPEHLVESELFGYEKGAFSGAMQTKQGLLELAHPGTLFLDEIGDLDARLQVKLLRGGKVPQRPLPSVKPGSHSCAIPARPDGRHSRACRVFLARAKAQCAYRPGGTGRALSFPVAWQRAGTPQCRDSSCDHGVRG